MAHEGLIRYLLLPELRLLETRKSAAGGTEFFVEKTSAMEVCPRCATPSTSTYDRRWVRLKDDPLRNGEAILWVRKRRFSCKPCKRPFTEPVDGVRKGYRTTQRYPSRLLWACEHFSDLKAVVEGIEGAVLKGRSSTFLGARTCAGWRSTYRMAIGSLLGNSFPNAQLVADKFHVLRLIQPAIYRYPQAAAARARRLAALQAHAQEPAQAHSRDALARAHVARRQTGAARALGRQEALNRPYRVRGPDRAKRALAAFTDALAFSALPELLTLRRTLVYWRREILAYFYCRLTNARTEGFNEGKARD